MSGETVAVPEAAAQLGVSADTAYRLIAKGEFPCPVLRIGRQYRIPTRPLQRLLNGEQPYPEKEAS